MNFIYVDPGLMDNQGHHANSCRHIVNECRQRGIPTVVLAYNDVSQGLRDEMAAQPWFRRNTYGNYDRDPICGWLSGFELVSRDTQQDLSCLGGLTADDIIYVNSAQPAQFMGVSRWLKAVPVGQRPTVVIEFGTDPGLRLVDTEQGKQFVPHPAELDPRAIFFRHTARTLTPEDLKRLHPATFDRQTSELFQKLLEVSVATLPLPHHAVTSCRDRTGARPITVAVMGHQRLEKGYQLMPELAPRLLAMRDNVTVLAHNSQPSFLAEIQQAMRAIAATEPRMIVNEDSMDADRWSAMLDEIDLILCPYPPERFIARYSAVASEAMANGIPLVVPRGTSLETVMMEFGSPGTTFDEFTVDSVLNATLAAVDDFDRLAGLAKRAATTWQQSRGAPHLVDAILAMRHAA